MKHKKSMLKKAKFILTFISVIVAAVVVTRLAGEYLYENRILKQVIERLQADSRVAEVLVTGVTYDEATGRTKTTIKFLEYDASGAPLPPKYFTFSGNIIQFQSLVIRFEDIFVRGADKLRGKSAYLFWKVFMLDGANTQEYEITKLDEVPLGYEVTGTQGRFQKRLWQRFFRYALDKREARRLGIKNAQIEAPGTIFVPGTLYVIKIEHDGGLRIDSQALSPILRGEYIPG